MALARDEWIGVQLAVYGPRAKLRFKQLEARKAEIEQAIGAAVLWRELPNHKESQIRLVLEDMDLKNKERWPEISKWLIEKTERFLTVFKAIVKDNDTDTDFGGGLIESEGAGLTAGS
jgi:hypothetical protein